MILQHDPFSLHTMLEGAWLHKVAFPTPMVWPVDESQGSSPLHGHGSWLMCEVTLSYKDTVLVSSRSFEMNWQQTSRMSSFYVGWLRGTCLCSALKGTGVCLYWLHCDLYKAPTILKLHVLFRLWYRSHMFTKIC